MPNMSSVFVAGLLIACVAPVNAAGFMRAGLWEMTAQSAKPVEMPPMSAEQRTQLEKMGVDVARLQQGVFVNKVCISPEMAERETMPQLNKQETGCQIANQQRSGNLYTVDMVCDGKNMKGKGTTKTTFAGKESFQTESHFTGTAAGQPVDQRMHASGKWLSADCGNVKPQPQPGQKK